MISPHGGKLIDLTAPEKKREDMISSFSELYSLTINMEQAQEIDNIAQGVFSPLQGFLTRNDFLSVLKRGRLESDVPWTIPIILDVDESEIDGASIGDDVGIHMNGGPIAVMTIEELYSYDKKEFAVSVFGTTNTNHPSVAKICGMKEILVGGRLTFLNHIGNPYPEYTRSPEETRTFFKKKGWKTVAAFQTRNPPHLGHEYVQKTALSMVDGIFINPLIGKKKKGDFRDEVILEAYKVLMENYYPRDSATMSVLHTEMRYGGPKEAIHHAIIRKNFGCSHFIVGRDHAGIGKYYGPFDAHTIFEDFPDLGITPIKFSSFFYCKKCGYITNDMVCPHDEVDIVHFSGKKIRDLLSNGQSPPLNMMRKEVADTLLNFENPFIK
ncbi:MAG: sulfate adenylyltransferase [Promethearchaeota archaeon]